MLEHVTGAERQLAAKIREFDPKVAVAARGVLARMRRLMPGAMELVYDTWRWLVVGFGPTERASEAIVSVIITPTHVTICFLQDGPGLPDPTGRLRGEGKQVRNVRLERGAATLDEPDVVALIEAAKAQAVRPLDPGRDRRVVIRAVSAKKRARRPAAAKARAPSRSRGRIRSR
jgi:hypothetical protein